jgi:hypothetical protein
VHNYVESEDHGDHRGYGGTAVRETGRQFAQSERIFHRKVAKRFFSAYDSLCGAVGERVPRRPR